jgi:hypothetical protein
MIIPGNLNIPIHEVIRYKEYFATYIVFANFSSRR